MAFSLNFAPAMSIEYDPSDSRKDRWNAFLEVAAIQYPALADFRQRYLNVLSRLDPINKPADRNSFSNDLSMIFRNWFSDLICKIYKEKEEAHSPKK